jgi:hypothetical protein
MGWWRTSSRPLSARTASLRSKRPRRKHQPQASPAARVVGLPKGDGRPQRSPPAARSRSSRAALRTPSRDALGREMYQLAAAVPSLGAVPRVVAPDGDGTVTIGRRAMRLLLALDGCTTVAEHATQPGLVTTLRELAELTHLGLVTTAPNTSGQRPVGGTATSTGAPATMVSAGPDQDPVTHSTTDNAINADRPAATPNGRAFWRRGLG